MNPEPNQPFDAATTVEHSSEGIDQVRPLQIPAAMRDEIVAHLAEALPNEGCGLLAGSANGRVEEAVRFFPGTNVDRSPVRYTMDPREVIDAMRAMREHGWHLAAIVHSHPRTQAAPSRTDVAEAYYPDARLLIVSFSGAEPVIGCWSVVGDGETRSFRMSSLSIEAV